TRAATKPRTLQLSLYACNATRPLRIGTARIVRCARRCIDRAHAWDCLAALRVDALLSFRRSNDTFLDRIELSELSIRPCGTRHQARGIVRVERLLRALRSAVTGLESDDRCNQRR